LSYKKRLISLSIIVSIIGILALTFLWFAGLIGERITTKTFLGNSIKKFDPGYRRAHGKGICFDGVYHSNGNIEKFSTARVFSNSNMPVIGRFSIGSPNPHAADNSTQTVSIALLIRPDDQSQWRMKLNNFPYFATRTPEGFLELIAAFKVDPKTGKPDPVRVAKFFKDYPEARKAVEQQDKMPLPSSFSSSEYYSINAFILVNSSGEKQPFRWSMRPHSKFINLTKEQHAQADHDFLFKDIKKKLDKSPLYWDLVIQLAKPEDPIDDPSQPWPENREEIIAGVLEVKHVTDQENGDCRDINFDPTLVPSGIKLSNDPVLAARAGIYSHSYNARLREIGFGKAKDAIGK